MHRQLLLSRDLLCVLLLLLSSSNGTQKDLSIVCGCRKLAPFFLKQAASDFDLCLKQSWMIGDRSTDIDCGRQAGTHTILINSNYGYANVNAEFQCKDLYDAAELIGGI